MASSTNLRLSVSEADGARWSELIAAYLRHVQATKKRTTWISYQKQLSLFERFVRSLSPPVSLAAFRPATLDAYLIFREQSGVSAVTRVYDAKCVCMLLEYAYREEFVDRRILRDYRVRRVPTKVQRCPTVEELKAFLAAVNDRWNPAVNPLIRFVSPKERRFYRLRDMAIFQGLIETACRINELLAISMGDLDLERMQVTLDDTKSNSPRTVPFTSRWLAVVSEWRKVRPRCDNEALFISTYGDSLSPNQLSATFRVYRDLAKLPKDLHLHSLRHYALTMLAEVSVLAAREIAGHKELKTTQMYTHARQEYNRQMQEQADPLGQVLINNRSEKQKARRKLL